MAFLNVMTQLSPSLVLQSDTDPEFIARKVNLLLNDILLKEFENEGKVIEHHRDGNNPELAMQVVLALNRITSSASEKLVKSLAEAGLPDIAVKLEWISENTFQVFLDCSTKFIPISKLVH